MCDTRKKMLNMQTAELIPYPTPLLHLPEIKVGKTLVQAILREKKLIELNLTRNGENRGGSVCNVRQASGHNANNPRD